MYYTVRVSSASIRNLFYSFFGIQIFNVTYFKNHTGIMVI